ncbi:hypothetical protein KDL44_14940 [bacterium]|nr:hypothetical protein [bacterium]
MTKHAIHTALLGFLMLVMLCGSAMAGDGCTGCNAGCADCCEFWQDDDGVSNFIEIGVTSSEISDNEDSFNQFGVYPEDWYTSGRLNSSDLYCLRSRFEARWQDVSQDTGRAWGRITLWPLVVQSDSTLLSGRAWDAFGTEPALVPYEWGNDRVGLRYHHREFDNMALNYQRLETSHDATTALHDLKVERLGYRWNLDIIGIDTMAQVTQRATTIDTTLPGASGSIEQTRVKLDATLSDELSAYGRINYEKYEYDEQPDSEFAGADLTFGMRYQPDCDWTFGAEYRNSEEPDDNVVSSHVQNMTEYGFSAAYYPGHGNSYEAGYKLRSMDYAKLDMQNGSVFNLLRSSSVITPADVAPAVSIFSPEYDVIWFDMKQNLSDRLRFKTRFDYEAGSTPGTELVSVGSTSLFFDKQLTRSHGLSWNIDDTNDFDFNMYGQESRNGGRDSSTNMTYAEGVWVHRIDGCSQFSLALRDTRSELDIPGIDDEYSTDDKTYAATYGQTLENHDYSLNFAMSDGSGAENYSQTSAGAEVRFKRYGPLGLRLDWFRRSYDNYPGLDSDAVSIAVDYRIKF